MKLDAKSIDGAVKAVQEELTLVTHTLKEKGSKRFEKPILFGVILVIGAYYLLYAPPQRKLDELSAQIATAKAASENGEKYKNARDLLYSIYRVLPKTKDKDHFLTEAVIETLKAEGLTSDSIQPPDDQKENFLIHQQIRVSAQMKFPEFLGWLARVEASRPFLHVTGIELRKSRHLGYCEVQAGISTMIPEKDVTR